MPIFSLVGLHRPLLLGLVCLLVVKSSVSVGRADEHPAEQPISKNKPATNPANGLISLDLLQAAAEQGEAASQHALAERYFRATGVTRDLPRAYGWYRKAGQQGHPDGQYKVFVCLNLGLGVKEDRFEAREWLIKAAKQNHPRAQHSLGILHEFGEAGIQRDVDAAVRCYQRGVELGDPDSMRSLATCYHNGSGVPKDMVRATELYRQAADKGHQVAQVILATLHLEGVSLPRDPERAFQLARTAAEGGLTRGQFMVGTLYYGGIGVPRNPEQAVVWYRKAAEAGDHKAMYNLGYCKVMGEGCQRDVVEAYALWTLAVAGFPEAKESLRKLSLRLSAQEEAAGRQRAEVILTLVKPRREDAMLLGY